MRCSKDDANTDVCQELSHPPSWPTTAPKHVGREGFLTTPGPQCQVMPSRSHLQQMQQFNAINNTIGALPRAAAVLRPQLQNQQQQQDLGPAKLLRTQHKDVAPPRAIMGLGARIALFRVCEGLIMFPHVQRTYGNVCVAYRVTSLANCTHMCTVDRLTVPSMPR